MSSPPFSWLFPNCGQRKMFVEINVFTPGFLSSIYCESFLGFSIVFADSQRKRLNILKHHHVTRDFAVKKTKKLMFYSQFRTDCHKADYLNTINNSLHKPTLKKFRLGNHKLSIETGRHTIPKTPENFRICPFCQLNEVEHEFHFIFSCQLNNNRFS